MYSVEDYTKTVILLLNQLGIKTVSVLSNHTGAFVAGELAAAYPERVEKLILSNPIVFGEEGKAALLKRFSEGFQIKTDGSYLMESAEAIPIFHPMLGNPLFIHIILGIGTNRPS